VGEADVVDQHGAHDAEAAADNRAGEAAQADFAAIRRAVVRDGGAEAAGDQRKADPQRQTAGGARSVVVRQVDDRAAQDVAGHSEQRGVLAAAVRGNNDHGEGRRIGAHVLPAVPDVRGVGRGLGNGDGIDRGWWAAGEGEAWHEEAGRGGEGEDEG
jgi:hypothetical protein